MADALPTIAAVVLAGGAGSRLGAGANKVFVHVGGRPLLAWSLLTLDAHPRVGRLVIVVRQGDEDQLRQVLDATRCNTPVTITSGGATRAASEHAALQALRSEIDTGTVGWVLVHDGARPFVSSHLLDRVIDAAVAHGGGVPGLAFDRPLYRLDLDAGEASLVDHAHLRRVQTPQGYAARPLLEAYDRALALGVDGADTADVMAQVTGLVPRLVEGDPDNLKVTVPADLEAAEAIAARSRGSTDRTA